MSYNGWSNKETWLISVWTNPESKEDVLMARDFIEDQYDNMPDGPLKDMVNFNAINWDELESTFDNEEEEAE